MVYPPTASESPLARFPSFPRWQVLRELAEQRLDIDGAASLYLSLAPGELGVIRDRQLHEHALIDELRKLEEAAERTVHEHERKLALRALPDRVDGFLASYGPAGRHIHGVAVFATADGYFRTLELPEALGDAVALDRSPRIAPLISLVARSHEALIVLVDHEHGTLLRWADGAVHELDRWSSNAPTVVEHFKRVAEAVDRATREERRPIVLVGVDDLRGAFSEHLDLESRELVAGWTSVEPHQPPSLIAAAAQPQLGAWWAARERELLDSWHEAAAKHTHGVAGFEDTLAAATDGAVDVLLFQDEPAVAWPVAYECENDGRASLTPGACPLDGGTLVPRQGIEVVLRETLRYGGKAFAIQGAEDLARARGVGAMTRF
jgi:hypothetical protein